MPEGVNKNKGKQILKIVSKILDFNLNEQNQRGQGPNPNKAGIF